MHAWYGTADIGRHTAVLAAVVAAASLAVSAWGTYKTAQVADDQLAQSRASEKAATRHQVSQVTLWPQTIGGQRTYVIANRSLDAAYLYLHVESGPVGNEAAHLVRLGAAPPCTRMELSVRTAHLSVRDPDRERPSTTSFRLLGLIVRDASGKVWEREDTGGLSLLRKVPEVARTEQHHVPFDELTLDSLDQCHSGTS
ncbi:hypothetical protein [Streptomyces muensis]|uniref:Uncharacterized protein n=1 Tax=Streptomyces muensis TaxID=1077944 RepID=A0A9X1TLE2_STRM4|nr:hypothetical protein [Streptomyces muensis]MCF1594594.1 hypothetical protein [Streptomyces muensis]